MSCMFVVLDSGKKRQLFPGSGSTGSVKQLEIRCKNFKVHVFSFKFASKSHIKSVSTSIVSVESQKGAINSKFSVENQKGAISIHRCSIDNQKGAIAVQCLWR